MNFSRERSRTTRRISPRASRKPVVMILTKNPLMLRRIKLPRKMTLNLLMIVIQNPRRIRNLRLSYPKKKVNL